MANLTIGQGGEIALPEDLCKRYGLAPDTPVRVVETRTGILLVPLTGEPIDPDLERELGEWQSLGAEAWDMFPYEDAGS